MITQEKFTQYINYIQLLLTLVDESRSQKHILSIMKHLHTFFPRDENGFSELEHYIFDNNFGKPTTESEYESPDELYKRLTK